jgi:hypothetical protein
MVSAGIAYDKGETTRKRMSPFVGSVMTTPAMCAQVLERLRIFLTGRLRFNVSSRNQELLSVQIGASERFYWESKPLNVPDIVPRG